MPFHKRIFLERQLVTDRIVVDTDNTIVDIDDDKWNGENGNKITLKSGDLNGCGSFIPTTDTGNQCAHENTEVLDETETKAGSTVCTDCNQVVIENVCKHA